MRIRWSEPAELDLDDLFDYIAREAGQGSPQHIRELVFRGYRVIYMIRQHDIQILGVIHGRRDRSGPEAQPWEE